MRFMGMTGLQCEGRARLRRIDRTKQGRLKNLANQVPFSMASIVQRAFNAHFFKKIIAYLAQGQTLTEKSPEYETLCNYGIINSVST